MDYARENLPLDPPKRYPLFGAPVAFPSVGPSPDKLGSYFSQSGTLYKYSGMALEFGLEKTKEALLRYFEHIIKNVRSCRNGGGETSRFVGSGTSHTDTNGGTVAKYVAFLSKGNDLQFACSVAEKALQAARF